VDGSEVNCTNDGVSKSLVLIVSEDARFRESVKVLVESAGLRASTFPTLQALLDAKQPLARGCLVFHSESNALSDLAQQARLRAVCTERTCILITDPDNIRTAVQASKAGIRDVVQTPYRDKLLLDRILDALKAHGPNS
jgi:FixJ family two-component response regulator